MAISPESYGRGQPVYDNGSFAPTKGTNDPTGYINRSLNNPSDSRSGLAQAALAKLSSNVGSNGNSNLPSTGSPGVLPIGDIKTLTITPTGQLIPDNDIQEPPSAPGPSGLMPTATMTSQALNPLAQAALSKLLTNGGSVGG